MHTVLEAVLIKTQSSFQGGVHLSKLQPHSGNCAKSMERAFFHEWTHLHETINILQGHSRENKHTDIVAQSNPYGKTVDELCLVSGDH